MDCALLVVAIFPPYCPVAFRSSSEFIIAVVAWGLLLKPFGYRFTNSARYFIQMVWFFGLSILVSMTYAAIVKTSQLLGGIFGN